jgi:tRNA threonylcarbamoyl adenosine modification protein YeaZ
MKCVLAIETSTARGSLALRRAGVTIFSAEFTSERTHNSVIFEPLAEALDLAGKLDLIVVGTGPGSYTGVRVGIAAAVGISMAKDVPVIGWNSIASVSETPAPFAVIGDARRGMWHFSEIHQSKLASGPFLETADEIAARCKSFQGEIYTTDPQPAPFWPAKCVGPSAEVLAKIAEALSEQEISALTSLPLEPIYLSAPFITAPRVIP